MSDKDIEKDEEAMECIRYLSSRYSSAVVAYNMDHWEELSIKLEEERQQALEILRRKVKERQDEELKNEQNEDTKKGEK